MTRPERGLLVSATKSDDGTISIRLDDVTNQAGDGSHWEAACFVTSKNYDGQLFDQLAFEDKELAAFGYYILARLKAFKNSGDL